MELFEMCFNLLLFYTELSIGFWITWILKRENPKIEPFPPATDLVLYIYIYLYLYIYVYYILDIYI